MYLIKYLAAVFFLLMVMSRPSPAATDTCSFSTSVTEGGTTFDIISHPAIGCAVQIVKVSARRGGKRIASVKADVDYLARSVQAADLTGDGKPELAIISRPMEEAASEALDIYWLDGKTLRRAKVPALEENSGYRGGDRYRLDGTLIVRTIPVYRDGDPAGKPSGGTHVLKYEFGKGALTLYVQLEKAPLLSGEAGVQSAPLPTTPAVEAKPADSSAAGVVITGVSVSDAGIEISTNSASAKYKTTGLDKPGRIVIDFPGAESSLAGKKIAINRFNITRARIGRNKGFLRVVLDTALSTFPKYEMSTSGSSILIKFT